MSCIVCGKKLDGIGDVCPDCEELFYDNYGNEDMMECEESEDE